MKKTKSKSSKNSIRYYKGVVTRLNKKLQTAKIALFEKRTSRPTNGKLSEHLKELDRLRDEVIKLKKEIDVYSKLLDNLSNE